VRIYGLDFTSAPGVRRKQIPVTACKLEAERLVIEETERLSSFKDFEDFLKRPGVWVAGIDFPFGQPRKLVENLGWPLDWSGYVGVVRTMQLAEFEKTLADYRTSRARGDKQHLRATDGSARAQSPMMLYGVPVGKMFFQGAPRLLASGVSVRPCRPVKDKPIIIEAYPALVARKWIGSRSYKNRSKEKSPENLLQARRDIVTGLGEAEMRRRYGFEVLGAIDPGRPYVEDPSGDWLDSLMCAIQAAWAYQQRDSPSAPYGIPLDSDPLEGWIVDPDLLPAPTTSTRPFVELLDLAGERVGGRVPAASDEFFAEKENVIKTADPVFAPDKYTDRGKWMDGWETRRRRLPGYDWVLVQLGIPGIIRGVTVDTRFFTGNYPERISLEACTAGPNARPEELGEWLEIIPQSPLCGDILNHFEVTHYQRFTHVRLNIFPDGGVARLRIHGEAFPEWRSLGREIDLAAAERGATILDSSDRHYGHPQNLIMPGPGCSMADGWETRRRRGPGHDWVALRLAAEGIINRVEVDTSHFKGNYPDACSLEASLTGEEGSWTEVLGRCKLQAHTRHVFERELAAATAARFARFHIYPDGGVSRLRLFGHLTEDGRVQANLAALNAARKEQAVADFLRCCGSRTWAGDMAMGRPYASLPALETAADSAWSHGSREDWLEAFSAHPAIGQRSGGAWSKQEQSGTTQAGAETLRELEELNLRYREKFGYTFIVCATGRTANEMLNILRRRLENDAEDEIQNAAEEQRLISLLRLRRLLSE